MTTVEVTNPDLVEKKTVNESGRIYVGTAHKGKRFEVVLREISEDDEQGAEA